MLINAKKFIEEMCASDVLKKTVIGHLYDLVRHDVYLTQPQAGVIKILISRLRSDYDKKGPEPLVSLANLINGYVGQKEQR